MAIIFMDSFDHYPIASMFTKGYTVGTNVDINAGGRWGTNSFYCTGGAAARPWLRSTGSLTTIVVGFAFRHYNANASAPFLYISDSGIGTGIEGSHCDLRMNASGYLYFTRNGTVIGSTGTKQIFAGVWYHLQVKVVIDNTVGVASVRVNGVEDLNGTGLDTQNGSIALPTTVSMGSWGSSFASYIDDLWIADGTDPDGGFLGDLRVQYLAPSGAGVRTQFAPSATTNYQTVDDTGTGSPDADYNSASTLGATDLFTMPDIGNGVVQGVQSVLRYKKDDAGFRTAQPVLYGDDGDTPRWYRGTKVPVYDTFSGSIQTLATSPLSGAAWTKDEINALQFGYAVGDAAMFTIDAKLV